MEKKMYYALSDNSDLHNLYLPDLDAVKEFIEGEIGNIPAEYLNDHEWKLSPVFMTEDEFAKLPEYEF